MSKVSIQRKKVKSLIEAMWRWTEKNKGVLLRGEHNVPDEWKEAFKFVTALNLKLDMYNTHFKRAKELTKEEMVKCNKYYSKYNYVK